MALDFPNNPEINDTYTVNGTTWQYNGTFWSVVGSTSTLDAPNGFSNISVTGQNPVIADQLSDTLNLVAGSNVTITTDDATDSVVISSTGAGDAAEQNLFDTIAVTGQDSIIADDPNNTITFSAGSGINLTTNTGSKIVTITSTVSAGAEDFTDLSDVTSAGINVADIYLPAITKLVVSNSGISSYSFDQYSGANPTIYAISGTTIAFDLNGISGTHPFEVQSGAAQPFNTGLVHVTNEGVVTTGADAQGKSSGVLYWKIPAGNSGSFIYQCQTHAAMVGSIIVKNIIAV